MIDARGHPTLCNNRLEALAQALSNQIVHLLRQCLELYHFN